jgi:hypothetical protein
VRVLLQTVQQQEHRPGFSPFEEVVAQAVRLEMARMGLAHVTLTLRLLPVSVRRILLPVVFILVALSVVVSGHLYLVRRLVIEPGFAPPVRAVLLSTIAVLFCSLLLQPLAERLVRPSIAKLVAWPAALWMGMCFLLLVLLALTDGVGLLLGATTLAAVTGSGDPSLVARHQAFLVTGAALLAGIAGVRSAIRRPSVVRVEVELARWPSELDGFRIVQLSDLHIGPTLDRRFAGWLVGRVNELAPDLIVITGDLVDGPVAKLADEVAPLASLRARHGVFFVTGNHEYYSGVDAWLDEVRRLGIRVLRNERVRLGAGAASFDLAGVDDYRAYLFGRGHGEDVPRALEGRDPQHPIVLLAHDPSTFRAASKLGIDLQLSGHTHGGQIWPFVYFVRLFVPYVAGWYRENGAQLYVSRGTGFWGPPLRLFAPAEISEIVLHGDAVDARRREAA